MRILLINLLIFLLFVSSIGCEREDTEGDLPFDDVQESFADPGEETGADIITDEAGEEQVSTDVWQEVAVEICINECSSVGEVQCIDHKSYKKCEIIDGCLKWSLPVLCGTDEQCENGKCVKKHLCDPLKKCEQINATKCEGNKVLKCSYIQYGSVNCLEWSEVETCVPPKKCLNGQCVTEVTGKTCAEIVGCIEQNQCQDQQCILNCSNQGSPQAQQQFNNFVQCVTSKCGAFTEEQPAQYTLCLFENCKVPYETCLGPIPTGTESCMDVLTCMQACGNPPDETCVQSCFESGTYDAQLKLLKISACIEKNCANAPNIETCVQQKCTSEIMACISG